MISEGCVYKAAGKVLLAGGYGVLEEGNYGLSIALDNHFYSVTEIRKSQEPGQIEIEVLSHQISGRWAYIYHPDKGLLEATTDRKNVFVENAVKYALQYSLSLKPCNVQKITLNIVFDRGFLSEPQSSQKIKDKFINYEGSPSKTGLGSSACVIVVIVGGILKQLLNEYTQNEVNCLSQLANIAAQNKIGSNFDISTAVYGSQLYKNVLPRLLSEAMEKGNIADMVKIDPEIKRLLPNQLLQKYSSAWMLDLRRGSNTRSMVTGFTKALNSLKQQLIDEFYQGNKLFVTELYRLICSDLSRPDLLVSLKTLNGEYRNFIQSYSKYTNVPVEPPEFKSLLDEITHLDKVVYCICPGSGGYDAIVVLALTSDPADICQLQTSLTRTCQTQNIECKIDRVQFERFNQLCSHAELQALQNYLKL